MSPAEPRTLQPSARPAPQPPAALPLDAIDVRLIDHLHGGFPLVERPYAAVARALQLQEISVLTRLRHLLGQGVLTRFGPLFQIERAGGRFVLCAMAVPEHRFDAVAAQVNAHDAVAHNYRRTHRLNLWFVIGTETEAEGAAVRAAIAAECDLPVLAFPKVREYRVALRLSAAGPQADGAAAPRHPDRDAPAPTDARATPQGVCQACAEPAAPTTLHEAAPRPAPRPADAPLDAFERALVATTQAGLPLVERPYEAIGAVLGVDSATVIDTLARLLDAGVIRRIGAVPNHYRLGWTANGMCVWDVDDAEVDRLGALLAGRPEVSHCYRRPRHGADWPYNLFVMLHGRDRAGVERQAAEIRRLLGPACRGADILWSTAILKKTGLRLRSTDTA